MSQAQPGDDDEETDWAEIFTTLKCHTSFHYDEILERDIVQLNAVLARLPKHLEIKMGIPMAGVGGGAAEIKESTNSKGKPPKLSEIAAFCGAFGGV